MITKKKEKEIVLKNLYKFFEDMSRRLAIALAQVKAGNNSENLLNEISQKHNPKNNISQYFVSK